MPIRLENMVTANIENNPNQPDLKDNLEWLSHGLKETLKLHHCGGQTRTEFGHNVMSTMMATTSINKDDDASPSSNNNNTRYTSSRHFNNNNNSTTILDVVHHPTTQQQLHCSPNKRRTPIINEFMSSVGRRHVSKMKAVNSNSATNSNHHHLKWVNRNNRVNKSRIVRRKRRKSPQNNTYIEDVRLGIQGKNTDYYHHQAYLSTQTLIQEAVKRLCALHSNNNNSNIINPNPTTKTTTPGGGVDMTSNASNIIMNNNNNGIVHQHHSGSTFCNINNNISISSTGNSLHMGLAGVV